MTARANVKNCTICRQGLVRPENQDRAGCFFSTAEGAACALAYVADGMGGHYGGAQASAAAAKFCAQWWDAWLHAPQRPAFLQCVDQLRTMLLRCHEAIRRDTPQGQICGTTIVLLFVSGGEYALFSAGDSRCYKVTRPFGLLPGQPEQLTHDDLSTLPGQQGRLTQALGPGVCVPNLYTGQLRQKTGFALCSDGVYKFCPNFQALIQPLPTAKDLKSLAEHIAAQTEAAGAPDNYSLVLLQV